MFQSDFGIVADYFVQMRKTGTCQGSDRNVRHMREVLQLLSALTNDPRFTWKTYAEKEGAEPKNMCEWIDKIEEKGMEKGIKKRTSGCYCKDGECRTHKRSDSIMRLHQR